MLSELTVLNCSRYICIPCNYILMFKIKHIFSLGCQWGGTLLLVNVTSSLDILWAELKVFPFTFLNRAERKDVGLMQASVDLCVGLALIVLEVKLKNCNWLLPLELMGVVQTPLSQWKGVLLTSGDQALVSDT